ncbi:MAG TPA: glutathione S-transferase family protein [Devosia sp.]|nr:glutathione S-transferase family protein [Devosia sp.]
MTLRILGRVTSINVRKVLWAAAEMGLAYEREDWGLPLRDPQVPEFLGLNPNGQVPVLLDGDFVLWESNAILLYLAEFYGQGTLWTEEPHLRARMYQWLGWQASELNPSWGYAVQALMRKTPGFDDAGEIAKSIALWTGKMELLEAHLARGKAYVAGDQFTLADIAIGLSVHRWMQVQFEKKELPAVAGYYGRLKLRQAAQDWMGAGTP